jgi:hypothetical protein
MPHYPTMRGFRALAEIARQLIANDTWDSPEECFAAHRLTSAEQDEVCRMVANPHRLPRPQDGTDQPALPVDADGWGFPVKPGTQQPTLW